jgi:hypothetical protein
MTNAPFRAIVTGIQFAKELDFRVLEAGMGTGEFPLPPIQEKRVFFSYGLPPPHPTPTYLLPCPPRFPPTWDPPLWRRGWSRLCTLLGGNICYRSSSRGKPRPIFHTVFPTTLRVACLPFLLLPSLCVPYHVTLRSSSSSTALKKRS